MAQRVSQFEAAVAAQTKAQELESTKVGLVYDLFCKTLKDDPELQWDRIADDMHAKNPWEDLRGVMHDGLHRKSMKSLTDCIDFHKLMVYSVDAAERQRFYMMCSLNLGLLPTIKNSPQAVASTVLGNVPFNKTTLVSIILSHLPVAWRTQYALTHVQYALMHALVPESPRAILGDLENIEKLFAERANEAARTNKAKVAATAKLAGKQVPRKGK